jgi:hypothetical protein
LKAGQFHHIVSSSASSIERSVWLITSLPHCTARWWSRLDDYQSLEAIVARYPSLLLEQVYATITYYLHNQEAVNAYLEDWLEDSRQRREAQERTPPPVVIKLRVLAAQRQGAEIQAR